ncbi:hypothetical protein ABZ860_20835 [Microbispora sp. NPDC046973]
MRLSPVEQREYAAGCAPAMGHTLPERDWQRCLPGVSYRNVCP